MIDVATRAAPAAVLRPTTKAADASVLLARALTPEPVRPGWPEALKMSRSRRCRMGAAAGDRRAPGERRRPAGHRPGHHRDRPRGRVRLGRVPVRVPDLEDNPHLLAACPTGQAGRIRATSSGTSVRSPHGSPLEFASGYAGRSPANRRGCYVEDQPLFGRWPSCRSSWMSGCCSWLNMPHDGLRDPLSTLAGRSPRTRSTPALVEAACDVPVALVGGRLRSAAPLPPSGGRLFNAYGIKLNWRTYDSEDLNPLRMQPSGVPGGEEGPCGRSAMTRYRYLVIIFLYIYIYI